MGNILVIQDAARRVSTNLKGMTSFFFLLGIIVIFYFQFHVEYKCSCDDKSQTLLHCWIYMVFPAFLILFVVLGINNRFQRIFQFTCRYSCRKEAQWKCHFCCTLLRLFSRGIFAGLVWVMVLYIDGDWYVCCANSLPKEQSHLPCKKKSQLTNKELNVLFRLRNTSLDIGLTVMAVGVFLVVIGSAMVNCFTFVHSKSCGGICTTDPYRAAFKDHLLEEVHNVIDRSLEDVAAEYVIERMDTDARLKVFKGLPKPPTKDTSEEAVSVEDQAEKRRAQVVDNVRSLKWINISNFVFEMIDDLPANVENVGTQYQSM